MSAAKKLIAAAAGSLALLIVPSGALADTTITVSTAGDAGGAGDCTLRQAIDSADTNGAVGACAGGTGNDTVVIPASIGTSIALSSQLVAGGTGTLTISGPGAGNLAVNGSGSSRVMRVVGPGAVTVSGLTISNGRVISTGTTGGGINLEAGGSLTLDHVTVSGNAVGVGVASGAAAGFGGGIFADGPLTLRDSTVEGNQVLVQNIGATAGDTAGAAGGGVYATASGAVTVQRSTIDGNQAVANAPAGSGGSTAGGGGISIGNGASTASFTTGTISENTAQALGNAVGSAGGGILSLAAGGTTLESDTLTENSASVGANLSGTNTTVRNTLISAPGGGGLNCNGAKTSGGYNLETGTNCGFTEPTDKTNVGFTGLDPDLADNGGPTKTHALLDTGPAIDAGNSFGETVDQRGLTRPVDFNGIPNAAGGDGTDIGAFEIQKACPAQVTPITPCTANMQTTPSSLNFGDILVGTFSAAQTVTVSNTGSENLTLGTVTLGGTNPGDFTASSDDCSSAVLVPSASCTIGVQFGPTSAGTKTATLLVSGDAPSNPSDAVSLRGNGIAPSNNAPPPTSTSPNKKRAKAIKRCKKKFRKGTRKRKHCIRKAKKLPILS